MFFADFPSPLPFASLRCFVGRALLFSLTLVLSAARPVQAGEEESHSRPGVLHLSLESAIRMALQRNYSIMVEKFNPQIAQEDVTRARGQFDPVLGLDASRLETSQHAFNDGRFSPLRSVSRSDVLFNAGLSGTTPIGTGYSLGLGSVHNSANTLGYSESYNSAGGIGLTQPLLRGLGLNANLSRFRIAKTKVQISEWVLRQEVIDTLTKLVYVYNDLHLAGENLGVAERSQALARRLVEDNSRRLDIGVMSPPDLITARADVAVREEGVIVARRKQMDNENLLKQLVTRDIEPMLGIRVEIERPPSVQLKVNIPAGVQDALQLRPEYRQAILDLQNRHVTVNFARNQVLPRLDLTGSLNLLGFDESFGSSLERVGQRNSTQWQAGVIFSYPLGNHVAKGDLAAARLSAAQGLVELQRQEQDIMVQVDNAGGQIISNRARILSTTEASQLAQESLTAGEQLLRAGSSTTFVVLELQKRLAEAQYAEVLARADYNKSVAEYYRQTGVTLQAYHVDMD